MARFNPPPGWPPVPPGWHPPAGWRPDPAWPAPPPGWPLWVDDPAAPRGRSRLLPVLAAVLAGVVVLGGGGIAVAQLVDRSPVPVPVPDPVPDPDPLPVPDPLPDPLPDPDPLPVPDPPPVPDPLPVPDPDDRAGVVATPFGLGAVTVGDDVSTAEQVLGLSLPEIWSRGECVVRLDANVGIGTVDNGGAVQTFVVLREDVRTPEGVGVGSTYADIEAAYPQWIGGMSDWSTQYGGRFVTVLPSTYGQAPDNSASARQMMFELDQDDVVRRYRVGAPPYVTHVDICSTPD